MPPRLGLWYLVFSSSELDEVKAFLFLLHLIGSQVVDLSSQQSSICRDGGGFDVCRVYDFRGEGWELGQLVSGSQFLEFCTVEAPKP